MSMPASSRIFVGVASVIGVGVAALAAHLILGQVVETQASSPIVIETVETDYLTPLLSRSANGGTALRDVLQEIGGASLPPEYIPYDIEASVLLDEVADHQIFLAPSTSRPTDLCTIATDRLRGGEPSLLTSCGDVTNFEQSGFVIYRNGGDAQSGRLDTQTIIFVYPEGYDEVVADDPEVRVFSGANTAVAVVDGNDDLSTISFSARGPRGTLAFDQSAHVIAPAQTASPSPDSN